MKASTRQPLVFLFLFVIALLPRLYHLDQTTIYPDEISWMVRGKESIYALSKFNFEYFNSVWWTDKKEHESIALPLTLSSAASLIILGKNPSDLSLQLFSDYTAARIPVAVISSLLIPAFYLLAEKFMKKYVAFLFAVLLAFDPVHLALSRWVMNDGLLTLFTFLAIFFFLYYRKQKVYLALTSLSLAAACLTRPTAVITAAPLAILSLTKTKSLKGSLLLLISILLLTYFLIWILWPGLWTKPLISYAEYFIRQATLAQQGITVFFMGQITDNPPIVYYPFQLSSRLPSLIVILLLISPTLLVHKLLKKQLTLSVIRNYLPQISFVSFSIIFLFALSLSALKIGVRYTLPVWPWIYLLAAWAFNELFLIIKYKIIKVTLVLIILSISFITLFKYSPDYYLFYNTLIGGPGNAQNYDLVGHCLGSKQSLEYVQKCYPPEISVAILGCSGVTAPYYFTKSTLDNWREADITIVDYTYKQLLSSKEALDYFNEHSPHFIAKSNNAILSEVYSKVLPKKNCSK